MFEGLGLSNKEVELLEKLDEFVKQELETKEEQSVAHRYDHLRRVLRNALMLAQQEGMEVDYFVLCAACLLHDIDSPYERKNEHVELSARRAREIMEELKFPQDKMERVVRVIEQHSTEKPAEIVDLEAKLLFDADKLDGVGAVGVARVFLYCGQKGMSIEEAAEWYRKKMEIAAGMIQTGTGRKLMEKRAKLTLEFLEMLEKEMG